VEPDRPVAEQHEDRQEREAERPEVAGRVRGELEDHRLVQHADRHQRERQQKIEGALRPGRSRSSRAAGGSHEPHVQADHHDQGDQEPEPESEQRPRHDHAGQRHDGAGADVGERLIARVLAPGGCDEPTEPLVEANAANGFPAVVDGSWQAPGGFAVTSVVTGPGQAFTVFAPAPLGEGGLRHPIVVFSVGTGGKPNADKFMLERIASHGFVVIAGDDGNQGEGDQALAGLDGLISEESRVGSAWLGKLDVDRVAAVGHSQGGNAAIHAALKSDRVTAVAPLMPGAGVLGGAARADESALTIPAFYICGGLDLIAPAKSCATRFATTPAPTWTGVIKQANHFTPLGDTASNAELLGWLISFLRAELMDDDAAGPRIVGPVFSLTQDSDWKEVQRKLP
jgi:pimeloyl-ACP methyl ester carboxylesterase